MRSPIRLVLGLVAFTLLPALAAAQALDEVKLKGKDEIAIKHEGDGWKLRGPGAMRRKIVADGSAWLLVGDDKKAALRALREPDGGVRVTDASGALVHQLKRGTEGFELDGPDGVRLYRVKLKPDKVNVYDARDQRLFHGKAKEDGYSIRDATDAQIWKVKGLGSLADLAYFVLPLEPGEDALLWVTGR